MKITLHPNAIKTPEFVLRHWLDQVDEIETISVVVRFRGADCKMQVDWSCQSMESFLSKTALMQVECTRSAIDNLNEEEEEYGR